MNRRSFLCFLPWIAASTRIVAKSFIDLGAGTSTVVPLAMTESEIVANELERLNQHIPAIFDREDAFFYALQQNKAEMISSRDMRIPLGLKPGGIFHKAFVIPKQLPLLNIELPDIVEDYLEGDDLLEDDDE